MWACLLPTRWMIVLVGRRDIIKAMVESRLCNPDGTSAASIQRTICRQGCCALPLSQLSRFAPLRGLIPDHVDPHSCPGAVHAQGPHPCFPRKALVGNEFGPSGRPCPPQQAVAEHGGPAQLWCVHLLLRHARGLHAGMTSISQAQLPIQSSRLLHFLRESCVRITRVMYSILVHIWITTHVASTA